MSAEQPLAGRRIVVTRPRGQAEELCRRLAEFGAQPLCLPTIDFASLPAPELDAALAHLSDYAWIIFTSSNAVRFFLARIRSAGIAVQPTASDSTCRPRIAAVGATTAADLEAAGLIVDFVPAEFSGATLAATLPAVEDERILVPCTAQARPDLAAGLRQRGATVDDIAIYTTVPGAPTDAEWSDLAQGADALTFTSPLTLTNFFTLLRRRQIDGLSPDTPLACIGPTTAAAAAAAGRVPAVVAADYTAEGLVTALCVYFSRQNRSGQAQRANEEKSC